MLNFLKLLQVLSNLASRSTSGSHLPDLMLNLRIQLAHGRGRQLATGILGGSLTSRGTGQIETRLAWLASLLLQLWQEDSIHELVLQARMADRIRILPELASELPEKTSCVLVLLE